MMPTRILVTGGKGGTGKTLISTSLAIYLARSGKRVLLLDADASNPCVALSLALRELEVVEEVKVFRPIVRDDLCIGCGECARRCPTHALIFVPPKTVRLIDTLCEGCALCMYVCSYRAIDEGGAVAGWIKRSSAGYNLDVLISTLRPGERREDTVVARLIEIAIGIEKNYDVVVVDGPAGSARTVLRLARYCDKRVAVVEPTPLGLHDLKRLIDRIGTKNIVAVLNKVGINREADEAARRFLENLGIEFVELAFVPEIAQRYAEAKHFQDPKCWSILEDVVKKVVSMLNI